MAQSTIWWLLAGGAIAIELLSGTFYLLILGLGFAVGALAAHAGLALAVQIVISAAAGGGGVAAWYFIRRRRPAAPPASGNPDVNLDVGASVVIDAWAADGTAPVRYRGAQWTAVLRPGNAPSTGVHRVSEIVGNRLLVDKL
ncbi:NfeD family protein [Xylophilus sp.]|uniref:NfeD family protein n=1 Tax=Xylophilus sp. TaxID=2653893 RepID=UPI0013B93D34|nr:NfeD family protein [Xylophilus sp.]KAF1046499.1 MAG: hypothetical protein GAK38_02405 [Xylophilus sp.]